MTLFTAHLADDGTLTAPDAPALPWWSFTKTLIAALTVKAAAGGQVNLDTPCADGPWSLRDLLGHRAGLGCYGPLPAYHRAVAAGGQPWSRAAFLASVPPVARTPPGTAFAYSNIGYMLLVDALEAATGKTLRAIIADLAARLDLPGLRLATTREDFEDLPFAAQRYHPGWVAHRCAMGTPADAVRLLRHILDDADLTPMQADLPLSFHDPARIWTSAGYGLGLMIGTAGEAGRAIGHSGVGPFSANAVYAFPDMPGAPIVAAFMPGGDEGPAERAAARLARMGPDGTA